MSHARAAANDRDTVAPFQKVGAVASKVTAAARWPLETRIDEMLRDPEALRLAYRRLLESERPAPLTDRERDVLNSIRHHQRERGVSPTLESICVDIGLSKPRVHTLLKALERKGAIFRKPRARQSILIVEGRS